MCMRAYVCRQHGPHLTKPYPTILTFGRYQKLLLPFGPNPELRAIPVSNDKSCCRNFTAQCVAFISDIQGEPPAPSVTAHSARAPAALYGPLPTCRQLLWLRLGAALFHLAKMGWVIWRMKTSRTRKK